MRGRNRSIPNCEQARVTFAGPLKRCPIGFNCHRGKNDRSSRRPHVIIGISAERAAWVVERVGQLKHCTVGQNDGVTIACALDAVGPDEMVRISRINGDAMVAAVQAVVKHGGINRLLQRTAVCADVTDFLDSRGHVNSGA